MVCSYKFMADRLIEAIKSRKLAEVRAAIKADPKAARSPRAVVAAGGQAFQAALELLHAHGADLNASWRNYRALHALIQERPHAAVGKPSAEQLACLEWLLKAGADPEQLGAWPSARAIIVAAFVGVKEYVDRLRKGGAKVDGFVGAALGDEKLVARTLVADPEFAAARDTGGLTALHCSAGSRMKAAKTFEVARMLIGAGADVRAQVKSWAHDVDAAYFAAGANAAIYELLLDRGADATEALVHAVWGKHYGLAEIALAHGAEPDRAVNEGKPLLNHLICWGQIPQTMWMLEHGASPNIPDGRGWTALHQAASRGNAGMMEALLDAGGDVKRRDRDGDTPVDVAAKTKREKLVRMMQGSC